MTDNSNDLPLPRTLKVGKTTVGLVGLDRALAKVLAPEELNLSTAAERVYAEIEAQNYIPPGAASSYRQALADEIGRLRGGQATGPGHLEVRILGPGCVSCNNLQRLVIETVAARGLVADVFQVHDLDEIGRFGVMQTPALVINGQVKSAGRLPSPAQVEGWLLAAVEG